MVEKTGVRLQKDFDIWWTEQCELIEQQKNKYNDFNQQQQQQKMITTSTSRGGGGAGGGGSNNNNKMTIDSASSVASSIQSVNSSVFQSRPNSSLNSTATSQAYYNLVSKIFRYIIFLLKKITYSKIGHISNTEFRLSGTEFPYGNKFSYFFND
jgi:hypothetical protein